MKRKIILLIKFVLKKIGLAIERYDVLESYKQSDSDIKIILSKPIDELNSLLPFVIKSKSQLKQDLFVLSETNLKKNGFFVEIGAANGIELSNTYLLETEFNWKGILVEPAKVWQENLKKNRKVVIEEKCIWKYSNASVLFNETFDPVYSTISKYNFSDFHHRERKNGTSYYVKTMTLLDLLDRHKAPKVIDYLSIDTEGSEYEILSGFDFSKYQIKIITCEHNYNENREKINKLLKSKGFSLKYSGLSRWDGWYVKY